MPEYLRHLDWSLDLLCGVNATQGGVSLFPGFPNLREDGSTLIYLPLFSWPFQIADVAKIAMWNFFFVTFEQKTKQNKKLDPMEFKKILTLTTGSLKNVNDITTVCYSFTVANCSCKLSSKKCLRQYIHLDIVFFIYIYIIVVFHDLSEFSVLYVSNS